MNTLSLLELYDFCTSHIDNLFMQNDEFDKVIIEKYFDLLQTTSLNMFDTSFDNKMFVSFVILYDQIPRHIYRNTTEHQITTYLQLVYPFVISNYDRCNTLTPIELSFVLLPLRHTNDFNLISRVLNTVWNKIKHTDNQNDIRHYKRFLNATYTRYNLKNSDITNLKFYEPDVHYRNNYNYLELFNKLYLDTKCWKNRKIVITPDTTNIIYKNIKQFVQTYNIKYGIISLSMGVDSVILSYMLKSLGVSIIAVHINYANRKECSEEERIVINWCKYILKIPLFVRTINEINRKDCMNYEMRDLYESYTKNIRFNAYRNANLYFDNTTCNVFTGHNRDDCFENILTNIANKSHKENLVGMQDILLLSDDLLNLQDIRFIRCMLTCNKHDIYECASNHQIPFFVDSTPKWSQRGKIRDIVRPALEQWNSTIVDGMFDISNTLKLQTKFVTNSVKETIMQRIDSEIKTENEIFKISFRCNAISKDIVFWKELFSQLNIYISNNSVDNFLTKIFAIERKFIATNLNVTNTIMLNKKNKIIWMYSGERVIFKIIKIN